MRRVLSIILLVLGGWWLMSEGMMAWMAFDPAASFRLEMLAFMFAFAAPFLLLGMWASPGNRFREIGLTMMIAVGVGTAAGSMAAVMFNDPGFKQLMPPDKPMPQIHVSLALGLINTLVLGGVGWLLWRFGSRHARRPEDDLGRVFD